MLRVEAISITILIITITQKNMLFRSRKNPGTIIFVANIWGRHAFRHILVIWGRHAVMPAIRAPAITSITKKIFLAGLVSVRIFRCGIF
ncbi:hypothetical protein ABH37_09990 [Mycobacterium haemophilum]|uniref:Uncharacterized protein n=1 Tax=Mycobacterium haemophilum TaxID=29311 RepID=A0A0I9UHX6_9MYCO|nr:hypothetical protein ABH38_11365 [Mycobacterium haemophilum]KLO42499.1 hypothetical protein ABH37_09990 [Mycobacterium haemophilum]KLO55376.1 hypothetical protein ABH36_06970 [Mycobacterium haemophilum]